MALVSCGECGKEVSDKAAACVGCGAPLGATMAAGVVATTTIVRVAKSRGVYIVLALFFGALGIHNFYAGYYGRAVAQLLITLLLGWLVIGLAITVIWALAECFATDTDSSGLKMV